MPIEQLIQLNIPTLLTCPLQLTASL